LLFFGGNKNDGVNHHLFDWGNAKIEKKSEKQCIVIFIFLENENACGSYSICA
jgi:hypothetical protein